MPILSHMPLAIRKAICARLIFLETSQPFRASLQNQRLAGVFNRLKNDLFSIADEEIDHPQDSTPLDQFLGDVFADLRKTADTVRGGKYVSLLAPLLSQVDSRAKAISCNRCSVLRPVVCSGGFQDAAIVANAGACIEPLRGLFDLAFEVAEIYYNHFSPLLRSIGSPRVVFSTAYSTGRLHDLPVQYSANASTVYGYEGGGHVSDVRLLLSPKEFDWQTYLAMLYLFFHECVCHVFYGLFAAHSNRVNPEPDDPFAEGWMDIVAYMIFEEVMEGRGPAGAVNRRLQQISDRHARGDLLHHARIDCERTPQSAYAVALNYGIQAADRLLYLLERLAGPHDPKDVFYRISMEFNLIPMSYEQHGHMVAVIHKYLPERNGPEAPEHFEPVPQILAKYLVNKDIRDLFAALASLN